MKRKISDRELASILALNAAGRYEYALKQMADYEELWSLRSGAGWILGEDDEGRSVFPVWPHREFAELCAVGEWADAEPEPIDMDEWIAVWIPGLRNDKRGIVVLPSVEGGGACVDADNFALDISRYLSQYD